MRQSSTDRDVAFRLDVLDSDDQKCTVTSAWLAPRRHRHLQEFLDQDIKVSAVAYSLSRPRLLSCNC